MAISLESLFVLAGALNVPPAYLLATTPAMADAILSLSNESESHQGRLASALAALAKLPADQQSFLLQEIMATGSSSKR